MYSIELDLKYNLAIISFNGTPHLVFQPNRFVGIQTWHPNDRYCIELTLDGGIITTEYDSLEKLESVLKKIIEAIS